MALVIAVGIGMGQIASVAALLVLSAGSAALSSAAGTQAGPAVPTPGARDPSYDPRGDLARWQAALAAMPDGAPVAARLPALRGAVVAAWEDQQPALARTLYRRAMALPAVGKLPRSRDLAMLHAWGALALANAADDPEARVALAAARAAAPPDDAGAQAFVAMADAAFAWKRDQLKETIAFHKRAFEQARIAFGPADPMTLGFQLIYGERAGYLTPSEALRMIDDAEAHAAALPTDHPLRVSLLYHLGNAASQRGRKPDARQLLQRALDSGAKLWGTTDPRLFNIVQTAAILSDNTVHAEALVEQAVTIAARHPGLLGDADLAMNLELLAHYKLNNGKPAAAVADLRRAVATLATVDKADLRWPHIQVRLARALAAVGERVEAVALVRAAMPQLALKLPLEHIMHGLAAAMSAQVLADAGYADEGYRLLRPVLAANEARALDLVAREQNTGVLGAGASDLFKQASLVALMAGQEEDGLRYAELANLSDLATSTAYIRYPDKARDAASRSALATLKAVRDTEVKARRGATAPDAPASAQAALAAARSERQRVEAAFERDFPDYLSALRPQPVPLATLRAQLAPGDAVVLPMVFGDRYATIVVTRAGLTWGMTTTGWGRAVEPLNQLRGAVERSADPGKFDAALAHRVYRLVFPGRVAAALKRADHLIFPTEGAFSYLPPQVMVTAAPAPGRPTAWLIRRFAISVRASLGEDRGVDAARSGKVRFAGIGDPALGPRAPAGSAARMLRGGTLDLARLKELPSLPSASLELHAMRRAFGTEGLLLTGASATERGVRAADLGAYGVLAFATHGLVSGEIAGLREPALVLTPTAGAPSTDDGLLTASEIAALRLDADWVILSACNTAADAPGGMRFSGLAQAFRLAGARALLLSHWTVRDDAAARLTVATVRGAARGLSRPEALRRAQLALIDDRRVPGGDRPFVWAPFVLVTR